MNKIDIEFEFRGRSYHAAIRIRQQQDGRVFVVTALNWSLERLLYGNHIIKEIDGILHADVLPGKEQQAELKLSIATGLSKYLNMHCFVGGQLLDTAHTNEGWEVLHPIPRHVHHDA